MEADSGCRLGNGSGSGGRYGAKVIRGVFYAGAVLELGVMLGVRRGIGELGLATTVTEAGVGRQLGATGTEINHVFSVS